MCYESIVDAEKEGEEEKGEEEMKIPMEGNIVLLLDVYARGESKEIPRRCSGNGYRTYTASRFDTQQDSPRGQA